MNADQQNQSDSAIKLRVPQDFKGEIEELAASMRISVSALTRLALGEYIKAKKAEATQLEKAPA